MSSDKKRTLGLLSVCAPVYNEEELVEEFYRRATEALGGLNYELIIVDDGSTDSTAEKLDRLTDEDPRLRVVHLSRDGLIVLHGLEAIAASLRDLGAHG